MVKIKELSNSVLCPTYIKMVNLGMMEETGVPRENFDL